MANTETQKTDTLDTRKTTQKTEAQKQTQKTDRMTEK